MESSLSLPSRDSLWTEIPLASNSPLNQIQLIKYRQLSNSKAHQKVIFLQYLLSEFLIPNFIISEYKLSSQTLQELSLELSGSFNWLIKTFLNLNSVSNSRIGTLWGPEAHYEDPGPTFLTFAHFEAPNKAHLSTCWLVQLLHISHSCSFQLSDLAPTNPTYMHIFSRNPR